MKSKKPSVHRREWVNPKKLLRCRIYNVWLEPTGNAVLTLIDESGNMNEYRIYQDNLRHIELVTAPEEAAHPLPKPAQVPIEFIVERTGTGYSAYAEAYAVYTVGTTLREVKGNMVEALNLHLEDTGYAVTEDDVRLTLDLAQFFAYYKVINVSQLAARLGMSQSLLAQCIGGQKKPSAQQTERIVEGLCQLGDELSDLYESLP
ncbi:hypothetical protein LJY25_03575 [Hymenobacter sp. BT175]|uniref:hypothetical protein n=1 Tax=Hymenobacter translucens TaxID=2886507 RepID=UPI001D0EE56D|nr:hypothetical protein [Hymenobacter translucens]MCC2545511.1 hypothetical protein [Hymenobacter translucens]